MIPFITSRTSTWRLLPPPVLLRPTGLSEINHKPMPIRSPADHHPVTASLKPRGRTSRARLDGEPEGPDPAGFGCCQRPARPRPPPPLTNDEAGLTSPCRVGGQTGTAPIGVADQGPLVRPYASVQH